MSDRELALSGALLRAVMLIRRGWMDSAISERIARDWPAATPIQIARIVGLAHRGVNAADRMFTLDPSAKIDLTRAPQLPQE